MQVILIKGTQTPSVVSCSIGRTSCDASSSKTYFCWKWSRPEIHFEHLFRISYPRICEDMAFQQTLILMFTFWLKKGHLSKKDVLHVFENNVKSFRSTMCRNSYCVSSHVDLFKRFPISRRLVSFAKVLKLTLTITLAPNRRRTDPKIWMPTAVRW